MQGVANYIWDDVAKRGFPPFDPAYWEAVDAESAAEARH